MASEAWKFYHEITPNRSVNYFTTLDNHGQEVFPCEIATIIVFYNEEGYTMEKTMKCLSLQHGVYHYGNDLLLVGDGLEQMAASMIQYLNKVFYPVRLPTKMEEWPHWANTCIINTGPNLHYWNQGKICLVLKKTNKGKWNSHEWMMKNFANSSEYCFLTDVGCQYSTDLLAKFIRHLDDHPNCVAVTGRRVAQMEHQQVDPSSSCTGTYMESMLRALQSHLFESDNNSRIENFIGCVPKLHGFCTFYRWSTVLQSSYVDLYFKLAYQSPFEVGFLMAQLRLAEDSVQGTYLLTQLNNAETHIVEDALVYFDVELSWEKFTKQRRRWDNSDFAVAKYLLLGSKDQPNTIRGSAMSTLRKIGMFLCMFRSIATLISYKFFIAIFAITFFKCNMAMLSIFLPKESASIVCTSVLFLYVSVYIVFVWTHLKRFGITDTSFNMPIWTLACLVNGLSMVFVLALIPLFFFKELPPNTIVIVKTVTFVSLVTTFLPWLRTCYMDPKRVCTVFFNIPNMLNIILMGPMVSGFMQAYHLARSMDLSWGNRPGMDMQLLHQDADDTDSTRMVCSFDKCFQYAAQANKDGDDILCQDHLWMKRNIRVWKVINWFIMVLNVLIIVSIVYCKSDTMSLVVCSVGANLHTLSILIVILGDFLAFGWKCLRVIDYRCKSLFACKQSERSWNEYSVLHFSGTIDP